MFLDTHPDLRMVCFAAALTAFTILLFGLIPAVHASRARLGGFLAERSQALVTGSKLGKGILITQLALSFILLIGAMLLARSLFELRTFNAGFRRNHLLIASPDTSRVFSTIQQQLNFKRRVIARVQALSASVVVPMSGTSWQFDFTAEGYAPRGNGDLSFLNFVDPGLFETMRTPFLLGRDFTSVDEKLHYPPVAVVNESLARPFWATRIRSASGCTSRIRPPVSPSSPWCAMPSIPISAKRPREPSTCPFHMPGRK